MNSYSDSAPQTWSAFPGDLHEAIRRRAEEIYIRNGRIPGRDIANWMQAEAEILREAAARDVSKGTRRAVVIRLNGVEYIGEYSPATCDGYTPGEFAAGDPTPVRFEGDKMFVTRSNGKELQTTVVKKPG
jgi:hypothetical protein